jgi:hypothetical protein
VRLGQTALGRRPGRQGSVGGERGEASEPLPEGAYPLRRRPAASSWSFAPASTPLLDLRPGCTCCNSSATSRCKVEMSLLTALICWRSFSGTSVSRMCFSVSSSGSRDNSSAQDDVPSRRLVDLADRAGPHVCKGCSGRTGPQYSSGDRRYGRASMSCTQACRRLMERAAAR